MRQDKARRTGRRARGRSWKATVLVGTLAVVLAACGDDDDSSPLTGDDGNGGEEEAILDSPGDAGEAPDGQLFGAVCELLTAADVEAVLGSSAQQNADDEDLGACHYELEDGVSIVTFQVAPDHAYDASIEAFSESATFEEVAGVGERASWSDDAFSGGVLIVLAGERTLTLSGTGSQDTAVGLMERVLERA